MTYTVSGGRINPPHSLTHSFFHLICLLLFISSCILLQIAWQMMRQVDDQSDKWMLVVLFSINLVFVQLPKLVADTRSERLHVDWFCCAFAVDVHVTSVTLFVSSHLASSVRSWRTNSVMMARRCQWHRHLRTASPTCFLRCWQWEPATLISCLSFLAPLPSMDVFIRIVVLDFHFSRNCNWACCLDYLNHISFIKYMQCIFTDWHFFKFFSHIEMSRRTCH